MFAVLSCVFGQHDLRLVLVAAAICATACASAFGLHQRSLKAAQGMRWAWAVMTGLVAGSGVWATHFIAMLAYQPHLPMGYDPWVTGASLAIAILGMGFGFLLPVLQPGRAARLTGGAFTGLSVAAMHFTGMAAVRAPVTIHWDLRYVAAALLIGALGAMAAFEIKIRLRRHWAWAGPAIGLVLAIVGLHFTAMTAVALTPDPRVAMPHDLVGRAALAWATIAMAGSIFVACLSLFLMERMGRRSTLSGLRGALDVVPAGLAFFDPEGGLSGYNEAFAVLMAGVGIAPAVGQTRDVFVMAAREAGWRSINDPDPETYWARHIAGATMPPTELHLPDGRWVRHESFRTSDGGGVTAITDVSEQQETARVLAAARDTAEAANRAKTQFLANMSHEIRTPLNGVLGVARVLSRTDLSDRQRQMVTVIENSGGLLDALLGDLLDLARLEARAVELRLQRTDLAELAEGVRGLFAARAEEKGLSLSVAIGPGAGDAVACDAVRMSQVLGNLVSNAIKFTEAGQVAISVVRQGDAVRFEVRDTGQGFDASLKAALFERFRQADGASTRRHEGAGLGLTICDSLVRLMGGSLDCESRPGEGSVFAFSLELPVLAEEAELCIAERLRY